jgi:hypothetical protein
VATLSQRMCNVLERQDFTSRNFGSVDACGRSVIKNLSLPCSTYLHSQASVRRQVAGQRHGVVSGMASKKAAVRVTQNYNVRNEGGVRLKRGVEAGRHWRPSSQMSWPEAQQDRHDGATAQGRTSTRRQGAEWKRLLGTLLGPKTPHFTPLLTLTRQRARKRLTNLLERPAWQRCSLDKDL